MTKASGIDGVPLPSDASPHLGTAGIWDSDQGTIAEYTTFYRGWGLQHGWLIDAQFSFTDPALGGAAGYMTDTTLCIDSSPIRTVIIGVFSRDAKVDQGRLTTILIDDSPSESSCP